MRFVLASASSGRLATLRRAGIAFEVIPSDVVEDGVERETVAETAALLASMKAMAVATRLADDAVVLGCDSLLEFDGVALGKPGSIDEAIQRWKRLRGHSGILHTGHCLVRLAPDDDGTAFTDTRTVSTPVTFADLSDAEIVAYCGSGEPSNVAGAFTIDGLGGWFVTTIVGDPHNVVGVSLPTLRTMLIEHGIALTDLGYPKR